MSIGTSYPPTVVALTVNRSPSAGYCEVTVEFELTDTENDTREHQIMRRIAWFEIGEESPLGFILPTKWRINNARAYSDSMARSAWQTIKPGFSDFELSPQIVCAVKEGGARIDSSYPPTITTIVVNRTPSAGYCEIVIRADLTVAEDGTRTHQLLRRVVWFEIGEEEKLGFTLSSKYRIEEARATVVEPTLNSSSAPGAGSSGSGAAAKVAYFTALAAFNRGDESGFFDLFQDPLDCWYNSRGAGVSTIRTGPRGDALRSGFRIQSDNVVLVVEAADEVVLRDSGRVISPTGDVSTYEKGVRMRLDGARWLIAAEAERARPACLQEAF